MFLTTQGADMIVEFKKKNFKRKQFSLLNAPKYLIPFFLVLIVASFLFLDKPLALFFHETMGDLNNPFTIVDRLFTPIFALLLFPSLFFLFRFPLRQEKKARKFWLYSLAIPVSVFGCALIQVILGRANPEWFFYHKEMTVRFFQWDSSFHSFPASISCNIGAVAACTSCLFPKWSIRILVIGFLLSLVPVITTTNFLSDALTGVGIGMLVSTWIYSLMKKEMHL
jgi:hypothetical protein